MSATPQDVQALIDTAVSDLEKVTSRYSATGKYWKPAMAALAAARAEAGLLVAPPAPVVTYLFQDDFAGPAGSPPDPTKWNLHTESPWDSTMLTLDGNGNLVVSAKLESGAWKCGFATGKVAYKGARHIEFRAQVAAGAGTWSALWEWGFPWGTAPCFELDVMEQLGKEPTIAHCTLHDWPGGNTDNQSGGPVSLGKTLASDFHVYAADVYPDHVDFSFDGVVVATRLASVIGVPDLTVWENCACIDLAMGGSWAGPVDPALTAAQMLVDYVAVWALA